MKGIVVENIRSRGENFLSSTLSDEVEPGSAGEQPDRNNPTGWNGRGGGENIPSYNLPIPVNYV